MKTILNLFSSNLVSIIVFVIINCSSTFFFFKSDTTTLESVANSYETTQTPKQERKNIGRLLIILAGSAVSLALILMIIHELYANHHMSHPIGVNHVENDVYEDIAADNDQRLMRCLWYQAKAKEFEYHWQTILNHLNHIHILIHSYVSLFSQLRFNVCKRVSEYQTTWRDWTYSHLIIISNMFWKTEIYQCTICRALPIVNNTACIRNMKQRFCLANL